MILALANDYSVIARSPDPRKLALSSPCILMTAEGRLLASYDVYTRDRTAQHKRFACISRSTDGGLNWTIVARWPGGQGRLFLAGGRAYYLGHCGDLFCSMSRDDGVTWSLPASLTHGQNWHQTSANVWYDGGYVYLAMELQTDNVGDTWTVPWLAPILLRAPVALDLTRRESWLFSKSFSFYEKVCRHDKTEVYGEYFGIPFFKQNYPHRVDIGAGRMMNPLGWLETNVVQIRDPSHYWFDPLGKTFHLLLRAHTGGAGYAAIAKAIIRDNGEMETELERVPSGRRMLFLPLPGGHLRFHILFDEVTELFWLLGSQATDSLRRPEFISEQQYGLPNNERNRLVLHFSKNLVDWCFAGLVASTKAARETRCYASMVICGEDLLIAARSGDANAYDQRDTNLITMHVVKEFRRLIY